MQSPDSDLSSDGGVKLTPQDEGSETNSETRSETKSVTKSETKSNKMMSALVPYIPGTMPVPATFAEVRASCQAALNRLMRLQQAANNQVGLPSAARDQWFEELREVAQHFISAQHSISQIEQAMGTERAQLQGALSAASNGRDIAIAERNSAIQEATMLRGRLAERAERERGEHASPHREPVERSTNARLASWIIELHKQQREGSIPSQTSLLPSEKSDDQSAYKTPTRQSAGPSRAESREAASSRPGGAFFATAETVADSDLSRRMAEINVGSPGENRTFRPPVTPLAERMYSRAGQQSLLFGSPVGPSSSRGSRYASAPFSGASGSLLGQRARRDTDSSGSLTGSQSSLHPSSSASNIAPRYQGMPPTMGPLGRNRVATSAPVGYSPYGELNPDAGLLLDPVDENFNTQIFRFFTMVKGWVVTYCATVDPVATQQLPFTVPRLWDYMCSVTYPHNRVNASSHTAFLLNDPRVRPYFVTRLLLQYIVQQVWGIQAWEGLQDKLTETLVHIRTRLEANGYDAILLPQERHELVDMRARAITDFFSDPEWPKVRSQRINTAVTRLRDIIGPLMNPNIDRQRALHELYYVSEKALKVSALLNTSKLSFNFIFNECGIKFSEQSHYAINSRIHPRELQIRHWRVMIVVTPGITYRDDAGISVDPRFIAKANILVMQ